MNENGFITIEDIMTIATHYPLLLLQHRIGEHIKHYRISHISLRKNFDGSWQIWEMKKDKTGIPYDKMKTKEGALERAQRIVEVSGLELRIFEWKNPIGKIGGKKRR